MQTYWFSIEQAIVFFPLIAIVLTVPYMLYNYRRYGSVSLLRSAILASMLFYLICAYFLVILPLPDPQKVAQSTAPYTQLIPFQFIRTFFEETSVRLSDPSTYAHIVKEAGFIQPLFNLLLTLPFGVYLSYYFRENAAKTVLFTFLLSLFFELTQLTGLYGIYPRPYRLFDVDDLMLNTLGGLLGYMLGRHISAILPSRRRMDESSIKRSQDVGYIRRLVAFMMDILLVGLLTFLLSLLTDEALGTVSLTAYLLYFVGLQLLMRGATPGKWFVHIRTVGVDEKMPLVLRLLIKYLLLYVAAIGFILTVIPCTIDWARSFRRGKRLWYERLSGTENESSMKQVNTSAMQ